MVFKRAMSKIYLSGLFVFLAANNHVAAFQPTSQRPGYFPAVQQTPRAHKNMYLSKLWMAANSRGRRKQKSVYLTHERDFFRQSARLDSMTSYVLVSTLTASMSFGALLGFEPSVVSLPLIHIQPRTIKALYKALCLAIQVVSGLSTLFGLYATIVFSLTILYGQSALGAERDREYDVFLRSTTRARVHGFRCFTFSLGMFALDALLVLLERIFFRYWSVPVFAIASYILYKL
ncbi:expressed unknown protein [Seminavis robusta]|uniref:DUF599 domain-containing protein n=1 Tax=Seminavis robusta TaxID=568900 RepID=A0A9N8DBY0_9STRA|nr:expressed unknown protein [Seminavis robusta]|eukprot:Sro82_g043970.1 n/a (233) ;mRNA; f:86732-87430